MAHTCGVNQHLLAAALEKLDKLPTEEVSYDPVKSREINKST